MGWVGGGVGDFGSDLNGFMMAMGSVTRLCMALQGKTLTKNPLEGGILYDPCPPPPPGSWILCPPVSTIPMGVQQATRKRGQWQGQFVKNFLRAVVIILVIVEISVDDKCGRHGGPAHFRDRQ